MADIVLDSQVGSTAGEFRVDESGSATYNIPIATVAGTAGVAPQISLNYASQSGNGLVGKGWSISGLSAITRCRQTLFQDQNAQPIKWSAEDRFCLDGQRLVLEGGANYGDVGAIYKTETDSFAKITSVGGTVGHPNYFTVERKDGSTSFYGYGVSAKLNNDNGATLTWAQNEFRDSVGNAIVFEYLNDAEGQRIDKIRYAYGGLSTTQTYLEFTYQDRPDHIAGYVAGHEFKTLKLLKDIRSYNEGTLIRQYNLAYLETPASDAGNKVSKLARVQECRDIYCLPPTSFTWSDDELGFAGSTGSVAVSTEKDAAFIGYRPADINGDGYMDMAWFDLDIDSGDTEYRFRYMLSDGNKLQHASFSNGAAFIEYHEDLDETVKMEAIDYNADGRSDIAVYNSRSNLWKVYLSKPQPNGNWKLNASPISLTGISRTAVFRDFNSDGLTDVLYWAGSGNNFYIRYLTRDPNKSAGSSTYYHFGSPIKMANMPWPSVSALRRLNRQDVVTKSPDSVHIDPSNVDFNGDGRNDVVISYGGKYYARTGRGWHTSLSIKWQKRYALVQDGEGFVIFKELKSSMPEGVKGGIRIVQLQKEYQNSLILTVMG
ncbi:MAG: SpvB/TcaC N-terminal domain-containing protein [Pseudomonadales bacterium]